MNIVQASSNSVPNGQTVDKVIHRTSMTLCYHFLTGDMYSP